MEMPDEVWICNFPLLKDDDITDDPTSYSEWYQELLTKYRRADIDNEAIRELSEALDRIVIVSELPTPDAAKDLVRGYAYESVKGIAQQALTKHAQRIGEANE